MKRKFKGFKIYHICYPKQIVKTCAEKIKLLDKTPFTPLWNHEELKNLKQVQAYQ